MGVLCGIVSESVVNAPVRGFYIIPIVLAALVYSLLPFTIILLNIFLGWLFGLLSIMIWSLALTHGVFVSWQYFFHLVSIITFSTILIYGADSKK